MLERSFIHIPGIGATAERDLWRQGCHSWSDLLADPGRFSYGKIDPDVVLRGVQDSQAALDREDHDYFRRTLGLAESWRAWAAFRHRTVYLDIETDGGSSGDAITTVGLWDGQQFRCLIRHEDLGNLPDVLSHYGLIVTFFGASFDLPMIQKRFMGLRFDQIHIDLCPTLKRLGYRGGLKRIEKEVGLARGEETDGLSGYDAIRLWRRWQNFGDARALETLIAYNREDVVNLEYLAQLAFDRLSAATYRWDTATA